MISLFPPLLLSFSSSSSSSFPTSSSLHLFLSGVTKSVQGIDWTILPPFVYWIFSLMFLSLISCFYAFSPPPFPFTLLRISWLFIRSSFCPRRRTESLSPFLLFFSFHVPPLPFYQNLHRFFPPCVSPSPSPSILFPFHFHFISYFSITSPLWFAFRVLYFFF